MTKNTPQLNPAISKMRCLKCNIKLPVADYFEGCPDCLAAGTPASVAPIYDYFPKSVQLDNIADWLVYTNPPNLGQGNTPLVALQTLAKQLGVANLWLKNEAANPTGSHKDRMSAMAVSHALDVGAKTIVAASSGNAGASLAAFAANVGLECVVVTTAKMSPNWRRAVEFYGAELIATRTTKQRWALVEKHVKSGDWYPVTNFSTPAVGSNLFGVDGYRSIAFELYAQLQVRQATDVIIPTSRGDLVWGIAQGFTDLKQAGLLENIPKVHIVEPFPRITRVLKGEDYRASFDGDANNPLPSLGGDTVTYQALDALKLCGGSVIAVNGSAVIEDQKLLGRMGFYLENSSAAPLTALRLLLRDNIIKPDASVILLGTSHGYKEYEVSSSPIKLVEP